jgi:hypothetical protein
MFCCCFPHGFCRLVGYKKKKGWGISESGDPGLAENFYIIGSKVLLADGRVMITGDYKEFDPVPYILFTFTKLVKLGVITAFLVAIIRFVMSSEIILSRTSASAFHLSPDFSFVFRCTSAVTAIFISAVLD